MGYLTFVDVIMAITFMVNTLVVIYNVYLKWLEIHDRARKSRPHRPGGRLGLSNRICRFVRSDDNFLFLIGECETSRLPFGTSHS